MASRCDGTTTFHHRRTVSGVTASAWRLRRYQQARHLHFITFSCYHRQPFLVTPSARRVFELTLERTRGWYGFFVTGYVVMPEHVHLLVSEPERGTLASALQMLKQISGPPTARVPPLPRSLRSVGDRRVEKLQYMHRNPVERGLAVNPEDWEWSSFRQY